MANVYEDEWDSEGSEPWQNGTKSRRLVGGARAGMSLYELPPRSPGPPYHFHHGHEEIVLVLSGEPRLRTPDGERDLAPGDVVHFARGAAGAHKLSNPSEHVVRYAVMSNLESPDAVEYPDTGELSVMARTESQLGAPLWHMRTITD